MTVKIEMNPKSPKMKADEERSPGGLSPKPVPVLPPLEESSKCSAQAERRRRAVGQGGAAAITSGPPQQHRQNPKANIPMSQTCMQK